MAASPDSSQLSDHGSEEFTEDVKMEDLDDEEQQLEQHTATMDDSLDDPLSNNLPPSKKRRTGQSSRPSTPVPMMDAQADEGVISSDTDGSIPNSPTGEDKYRMPDEDPMAHEQVTTCKWEACPVGDLGNMDKLVQHLQDEHVAGKQTNYACEWFDCLRKGQAHASGYALKAHMRSHTKEKPFYCALPECDRSFTRSDALAKHMRTVHETEALRPSDPVPRNYSSTHFKPQRLKLVLNAKPPTAVSEGGSDKETAGSGDPPPGLEIDENATIYEPTDGEDGPVGGNEPVPPGPYEYPDDVKFTEEELGMSADALFKLLRRQVHWAEEESKELLDEVKTLEEQRREEWVSKELVLANLVEAELATAHARETVSQETTHKILADLPPNPLPMTGDEPPWYRKTAP